MINVGSKKVKNVDDLREILNDKMEEDQKYDNPAERKRFQQDIWKFIDNHYDMILSDKGDKKNGDYPAAPYATWLLIQHMDAYPDIQKKFASDLEKNIRNFPKLNFLKDRVKVNEWIMKNYKKEKYLWNGKPLPNPTSNVRDSNYFEDVNMKATSAQQALKNAIKANNFLLADAVTETGAKTQPSYQG
jgi:hypothetical protein